MNKKLYLFVGYPGAGKTTIAMMIQNLTSAKHIWVDKERKNRFKKPAFSPEENKLLYDELNKQLSEYLETGESVIFDTNLNFKSDRLLLTNLAEKANAEVVLIWVNTDKQISKNRALQASSHDKLRVLGSMDQSTFDKIAAKLEAPTKEEKPLIIDGQHLSLDIIEHLITD